ncbi:DUF6683 family protein [Deinococcus aestuarii]|uniref:DUF6683 family protein n=1 Tax=Deinococcus aestuarii TaxID=2774531 RepID=UPI001C0C07EF|nr:DUF6683 family protein [Deinococcus aestuarii]
MTKLTRPSLLLLALLSPAALAQGNPLSGNPLSGIFDRVAGQAQSGQPAPAAAAAPANEKVLTYQPSPRVSSELRTQFVNGLITGAKQGGTLSAANERQLRDGLARVDIAAEYGKLLKPRGYDVYNVATALTLYVVSSFEVLDGVQTTDAQDRATYEQFRGALLTIPGVARMTDADKQKFAEGLMWLTAFQSNDVEQAKKGTPGYSLEKVRAQIKGTLQGFRLDPDRIRLGEKGLQARK